MVYGSDSIGDWTISTEGHFKEANTPSHHLTKYAVEVDGWISQKCRSRIAKNGLGSITLQSVACVEVLTQYSIPKAHPHIVENTNQRVPTSPLFCFCYFTCSASRGRFPLPHLLHQYFQAVWIKKLHFSPQLVLYLLLSLSCLCSLFL